jgi:hypothetical protein
MKAYPAAVTFLLPISLPLLRKISRFEELSPLNFKQLQTFILKIIEVIKYEISSLYSLYQKKK